MVIPSSVVKTLTIKVSDALFAEIAGDAAARNVPKSEIARERLSRKPAPKGHGKGSLWSRMEDLVIRTEDVPHDLSSNKEHLKNYGKNGADR
jgi:hypothetical protein